MRVVVRPLGRNAWSGVVRYKNCIDYLGTYFTRSGNRYTGLSKEDEDRLGAALGLDLNPRSSFWDTFNVPMTGKDLYLDTSDPMDELKYLFLKNHKRVQPSMLETKPGANYVIINKDQEAKEANVFGRIKRRASIEFEKMSIEDMRKCLRLYGYNAEGTSNEVIESTLFNLVEGNPSRFLDKWVDNQDRELEVILEKAVAKNVVRRSKNLYKYGSEVLGSSKDIAIAYLKDPSKRDIRDAITRETEGKPDTLIVDRVKEVEQEDKEKSLFETTHRKKQDRTIQPDGPSNEELLKG